MVPSKLLGKHVDKQKEAAAYLYENGPVPHDELAQELDIENGAMQAVIRGLIHNGILDSRTDATGKREYLVADDADIDEFLSLES